jgi:hypothetical protein
MARRESAKKNQRRKVKEHDFRELKWRLSYIKAAILAKARGFIADTLGF